MRNTPRIVLAKLARPLPTLLWLAAPAAAGAQVVPDRADPALVTRSLAPPAVAPRAEPRPAPAEAPTPDAGVADLADRLIADRIVVDRRDAGGPDDLTAAAQSAARPFAGRPLSRADLVALAGAVADVARGRGLIFATAAIPAQSPTDGVLHVTLDEGRIDAVRSLGQPNPAADRILATLVTHRGVTRPELEHAILLVGDVAGVRIKATRYQRESGFGILLVTVETDRLTSYVTLDNRGTDEIGPIRGVALVNLRDRAGDEIGLVAALTPINPSEFQFVSGRFSAPIGLAGGVASTSVFYGHTHAGGRLASLNLTGDSYGVAVGYSLPIKRSRERSLWFDVEARTLKTDQWIGTYRFRDDALTVLSSTLRGSTPLAGGTMRFAFQGNAGLPLPGVTHEGDSLASRADGDARYVSATLQADWLHPVAGPVSLALASVAQVASRPLLASAQVSLGGPGFARAYDYSERTGDQGIMGSAELRVDLPHLTPLLGRIELYAFGDGGTVEMLRNGLGGGGLASGGGGLRLGRGAVDAGVEIALPITDARFATGDHSARLSGQVAFRF